MIKNVEIISSKIDVDGACNGKSETNHYKNTSFNGDYNDNCSQNNNDCVTDKCKDNDCVTDDYKDNDFVTDEKSKQVNTSCSAEKIALIFGASSGIGLSTALLLKREKFTVFNASRRPCPILNVINIEVDVVNQTGSNSIATAFNAINVYAHEHAGSRLELIVYSAGFSMAAPIELTQEDDYRYLFEVNFFGFVSVLQQAIPLMRKNPIAKGGRIVVVSSMGGIVPLLYDPFYSSSKAAIDMLVREVNLEVNQFNIYLTSIQAGGTCTEFTAKRKVYDLLVNKAEFSSCSCQTDTAQLNSTESSGQNDENSGQSGCKNENSAESCENSKINVKNKDNNDCDIRNNVIDGTDKGVNTIQDADIMRYAEDMAVAVGKLADIEQKGANPSTVGKCIVNTLKKKKPPIIVQVGLVNKIGKVVCTLTNSSASMVALMKMKR